MISGLVTVDREAVIRLTLRGSGESQIEVDAVIDTGFDGWLSLPPTLISQLGLPWRRRVLAVAWQLNRCRSHLTKRVTAWDDTVGVRGSSTPPLSRRPTRC